jgi:hypothetical protein
MDIQEEQKRLEISFTLPIVKPKFPISLVTTEEYYV